MTMIRWTPALVLLIAAGAGSAHAQEATDIFVAPLRQSGRSVTVGSPVNVTHRAGYDNQPSFTPDGEQVIPERLGELVGELSAAGIRVFLPAAGTGEFHSLSVDEVVLCVRTARAAAPQAVLIAPIGFGIEHAVAIGRRSLDAGANGLLLMPPIHPYLCDAGFRDYVVELKRRLGAPLSSSARGARIPPKPACWARAPLTSAAARGPATRWQVSAMASR